MLTGEYSTEVSDASGMQLLDVGKRCWSDEVLDKLGIDKLYLGKVYESPEITGYITEEIAALTGLLAGTPVVGGAGDNAAAAVGTGTVVDGAAFTTIGTSGVVYAHEHENIWLTQKMMAILYDVTTSTINEHIMKVYSDGELTQESTIRDFRIVQTEGTRQVARNVIHYNLQMIIAVGFKVQNERAVRFRKWAGQIVKDYTIQGWTMDVDRLKKGTMFTDEYFERQLANILFILIMQNYKLNDIFQ